MNSSLVPFSIGSYRDPPLEISEWSTIQKEGFRVFRLVMGTQSGTHIDAPAHFLDTGAGLELLPPDEFIGDYFLLNLKGGMTSIDIAGLLKSYNGEKILFLKTPVNQRVEIPLEALLKILCLPPVLLALSGEVAVKGSAPFAFYRTIAKAAKFIVEDLDQNKTEGLPDTGEMFIFPLRLIGVAGSPCRVLARITKNAKPGKKPKNNRLEIKSNHERQR
jgi:kynurenine formamidase